MKMVKAIIRPEKEYEVISALEGEGFYSLTKVDILGRGKQKGIQVGEIVYDELAKLMLILVVDDNLSDKAIETIKKSAYTGNYGDGKIFVIPVEEAYTIRTGNPGL